MLRYKHVETAVGRLRLVADESSLLAVLWPSDRATRVRLEALCEDAQHTVFAEVERQLAEYFEGKRTTFDLPIRMHGTEFQKRVWQELLRIPYGQTRSYGELARAIGKRSASRAVGLANSRNPLSIIVPCHRVIGATGKLTGFAGGIETKARLLKLEGACTSAADRTG
ncbi:MAG: methylated-DNA--[protein]-cysteine S-methyltransferase [Nitrospira sp.]|nr:methylated-DNA--[protein]-cysteine S-methyltransferase [Nitrospira sp.]